MIRMMRYWISPKKKKKKEESENEDKAILRREELYQDTVSSRIVIK